jgi:hypothetical protein
VSASHQPSSSAAKRGPGTGPKGKKQKPVSEYSWDSKAGKFYSFIHLFS